MSPEENKALVSRFVEAIFNRGMLDRLPAFIAINAVEHITILGEERGIDGMKEEYAVLLMAFPEMHFAIDAIVAEEDMVAWRSTMRGTHNGPYRQYPATGRHVTLKGVSFERVAGDKIMERWANLAECEILRQIGAIDR
ncbi:MAG: ester cyclase [Halobacteriota archaeon]